MDQVLTRTRVPETVRGVVPRRSANLNRRDASKKAVAAIVDAIVKRYGLSVVLKDAPFCPPSFLIDEGQVVLTKLLVHDERAEGVLCGEIGKRGCPEAESLRKANEAFPDLSDLAVVAAPTNEITAGSMPGCSSSRLYAWRQTAGTPYGPDSVCKTLYQSTNTWIVVLPNLGGTISGRKLGATR